jgi:hypothetical protein
VCVCAHMRVHACVCALGIVVSTGQISGGVRVPA